MALARLGRRRWRLAGGLVRRPFRRPDDGAAVTVHRLPRPSDATKPRVLLVDDHRGVLDRVSELLADDFDVAGVATDSRHAVDIAGRIAPDLVVLDIHMPGLNG